MGKIKELTDKLAEKGFALEAGWVGEQSPILIAKILLDARNEERHIKWEAEAIGGKFATLLDQQDATRASAIMATTSLLQSLLYEEGMDMEDIPFEITQTARRITSSASIGILLKHIREGISNESGETGRETRSS